MADTAVKICGLQSVEVVKSLLHLPIEMIGLVFAKSRRQIAPGTAAQIVKVLQDEAAAGKPVPKSVGVFVNPSLEELELVLREAALDVVQLHGQESPEFCRSVKERFPVRIMKAMSVKDGESRDTSRCLNSYQGFIDALLVDAYDPVYGGGSGTSFDWSALAPYQEWTKKSGIPLLVAGGLHEHNVQHLIASYHPDGVDVSSGVEREGIKDINKITAFVERVKGI
ncbi:phosphoribosylanthranilate isomerase [Paenibacillus caui]|uniref:phosphoribosylanthranilate isomerase n=1 Tax=Paenibacillus caui TaxID=2873927 RepID=UPI001CA9C557|nr:phosphoribosylanthranilate isomerase [Paenibacillus caui]